VLPFGGFVKIFGENGEGEMSPESFAGRPAWQRFVILSAGVFMNLVLAWVLFSISAGVGVQQVVESESSQAHVSVLTVSPDSPAANSGIKFGDEILSLSVDGDVKEIKREEDVGDFVGAHKGKELLFTVERGSETHEVKVFARENPPAGEGAVGISMGKIETVSVPWYTAPWEGLKTLGRSIYFTLYGFWFIISELIAGRTDIPVTGPIGIFVFANDIRHLGVSFFLNFMGILSVNLAIINFLPIPALDGGRVAFLLYEKLRGKRINPAFENYAHLAGFIALILLMILVTYRDIRTFF
jgi:regulator of sigma E protease